VDVSFWGAQAASLEHLAAGQMHRSGNTDGYQTGFAASYRELQAGSLCSPEPESACYPFWNFSRLSIVWKES